jgi:hypothetical protein
MDKHGKVRIYTNVCGEDTPTHEVSGPYVDILETLRKLFPFTPGQSIDAALHQAAWRLDIVWCDGHRLGVQVLLISGAQSQGPQVKPQSLDEKPTWYPQRGADGRFIRRQK